MCCFGVECFCRLGVPLSKSHNLAKNKTKQTPVNSSSPFCWFALPFQLLRLGCFAIIIIIIIIFFSPFSSPPPVSSYREVMRLRSAGVFYGVWGRAPASEVSAASWRCECIRVCLICGITAESLRGGKEGRVGRRRGGRYKRADIVLATSSPPFPRRPRFEELLNSAYHYTKACCVILSNYMKD